MPRGGEGGPFHPIQFAISKSVATFSSKVVVNATKPNEPKNHNLSSALKAKLDD